MRIRDQRRRAEAFLRAAVIPLVLVALASGRAAGRYGSAGTGSVAAQRVGASAAAASQARSNGARHGAAVASLRVQPATRGVPAGWIATTVALQTPGHPFPDRRPAPPLNDAAPWINTDQPLTLGDLRGKFVLLDFWTYCCINCMHILPELKKLEKAYPHQIVVIGVHSAKFQTERDSRNILEAVARYEVDHPVVNDADLGIWNRYGVTSWPSLRIIDPEGQLIAGHSGEVRFEALDRFFKTHLPYYRRRGTLDETPLWLQRESRTAVDTPLRFPGKVLADEAAGRLYIADSNHNRVVVTDLAGNLLATIGSGEMGRTDGGFAACSFHHPQGMAVAGQHLYVADTENHLLRKVDLAARQVTTVAGTGQAADSAWPGLEAATHRSRTRGAATPSRRWRGRPRQTALSSPWALCANENDLYIAMAGVHQIWKMPLDESEIGPYAGNGREDIVDGPLLPRVPYQEGHASFAQPSGLTSDGKWLYVADSEGSSIRAVPFEPRGKVTTLVGTAHLPTNRLFTFGDVDGEAATVRLQHVLDVAYGAGQLYIADTYNNKIKILDPARRTCTTLAGTGAAGTDNDPAQFNEPAGVAYAASKLFVADTNNHVVRVIDLDSDRRVATLTVTGLAAPAAKAGD